METYVFVVILLLLAVVSVLYAFILRSQKDDLRKEVEDYRNRYYTQSVDMACLSLDWDRYGYLGLIMRIACLCLGRGKNEVMTVGGEEVVYSRAVLFGSPVRSRIMGKDIDIIGVCLYDAFDDEYNNLFMRFRDSFAYSVKAIVTDNRVEYIGYLNQDCLKKVIDILEKTAFDALKNEEECDSVSA